MKKEENQNIETTIDNIVNDTMKNLKNMVDANVVIGKPQILKDGTSIIPVSKVIVGLICGGGELNNASKKSSEYPFAGGSGAGYTVMPIGVLSGKNGHFSFIPIENKNMYSELLVTVNDILKTINKESKNG